MPSHGSGNMADGAPAPPGSGWLEILAVVGLFLVWPAGVVLLWRSKVWSTGEKLIGTLVPPGGGTGAPLLVVWWLLAQPPIVSCTDHYANGSQVSSTCPSPQILAATGVVFTVLVNAGLWLVPLLAIGAAIFLAWRAWPPARPRLMLVLGIVAAPVVLLTAIGVGLGHLDVSGQRTQQTAGTPPPLAPPSTDLAAGTPALPNLTTSQLASALVARGFSCNPPVRAIGTWATACRGGSGVVQAIGPDDHTIELLTATVVGDARQNTGADQASQFLDAVVQSACQPVAAGRISVWARSHLDGGQTAIDGYDVTITNLAGTTAMIIDRSRP